MSLSTTAPREFVLATGIIEDHKSCTKLIQILSWQQLSAARDPPSGGKL